MSEPDVVVFGDVDAPGGRRRSGPAWWRRRPWLPVLAAGGLVVAFAAYAVGGGGDATVTPAPTRPIGTSQPQPSFMDSPDPVVTEVGPLLGVTGSWELFGRGTGEVVRIEFARGRVTRTPVPSLSSSGPVSFVVGRDWAIVRPLDLVPGYVVRDGRAAAPLTGSLRLNGPALPGPDADHVWVPVGDGDRQSLVLVGVDGRPTDQSIAMPPTLGALAEPDGAGYVLLRGISGVYDARPSEVRRITTGVLLAVGPTRWLVLECDEAARCATIVIDRTTGRRRVLGDLGIGSLGSAGVISPDGAFAAVPVFDRSGSVDLHLVDLSTRADRKVEVSGLAPYADSVLVWSPDGKWLLALDEAGRLHVVDTAGRVHNLGVALPPLKHVAVRAVPTKL